MTTTKLRGRLTSDTPDGLATSSGQPRRPGAWICRDISSWHTYLCLPKFVCVPSLTLPRSRSGRLENAIESLTYCPDLADQLSELYMS
jgi:hypothetical protein